MDHRNVNHFLDIPNISPIRVLWMNVSVTVPRRHEPGSHWSTWFSIQSLVMYHPINIGMHWPWTWWPNISTPCLISWQRTVKFCWYSVCIWIKYDPPTASNIFILSDIYSYHILCASIIRAHALLVHALHILYIYIFSLFGCSVSRADYSKVRTNFAFIYAFLIINGTMYSYWC